MTRKQSDKQKKKQTEKRRATTHPSRQAMLKEDLTGKKIDAHLKECEDCRTLHALVKSFAAADASLIETPSEQAVQRYCALPTLSSERSDERIEVGKMVFDSWTERHVTTLRDLTDGLVRRMCLSAGNITLEIVAERRGHEWEFVARVYDKNTVTSEYVLNIGRRKLQPKAHGFYFWRSSVAPATFRLLSGERNLEFGAVTW